MLLCEIAWDAIGGLHKPLAPMYRASFVNGDARPAVTNNPRRCRGRGSRDDRRAFWRKAFGKASALRRAGCRRREAFAPVLNMAESRGAGLCAEHHRAARGAVTAFSLASPAARFLYARIRQAKKRVSVLRPNGGFSPPGAPQGAAVRPGARATFFASGQAGDRLPPARRSPLCGGRSGPAGRQAQSRLFLFSNLPQSGENSP